MREIKFRVWDTQSKKMVSVTRLMFPIKDKSERLIADLLDNRGQYTSFGGFELMQYTGLKDKNGKEIYEGDIISVVDIGTNPSENSRHQVVYCGEDDYPAFDLKPHIDCDSNGLSYLKAGGDEEMIVIGNIYENPELLEEK